MLLKSQFCYNFIVTEVTKWTLKSNLVQLLYFPVIRLNSFVSRTSRNVSCTVGYFHDIMTLQRIYF